MATGREKERERERERERVRERERERERESKHVTISSLPEVHHAAVERMLGEECVRSGRAIDIPLSYSSPLYHSAKINTRTKQKATRFKSLADSAFRSWQTSLLPSGRAAPDSFRPMPIVAKGRLGTNC
jgi:hypothetical protein